ncbi:MAG: septum formation protein Maf [Candidatus Eremiobacteraeota bacterium]|nr:septum formation protein Maf [Candidatus Eremiobacteraeota bacterium]
MNERGPLERIVLASASPRRLELLQSLGLSVEVIVSGYREPPAPHVTPCELASLHAREKLARALERIAGAGPPVVAADTVVELDARPLGKPRDAREALCMLRALSGRQHLVHTAFALAPSRDSAWIEERSTTRVAFHPLTEAEIGEYVAGGEPLDKAGAYGAQGLGSALIESIEGDFYTVVGFPLGRFVRVLRRLGFSLRTAKATLT